MNGFIVLAIILAIIAIIVVLYRQFSTTKRYQQLIGSGKESIGEILAIANETKKDLGETENSFSQKLTVKGMPKCDEPLISPLGQKPCIWYQMTITSERKELRTVTDSKGHQVTRPETVTETVDSSNNHTRFKIDDGTGEVLVDPDQFEGTVVTVDKSERAPAAAGATIGFGKYSLTLPSTSSPETLHYHEEIIGLDRPLTVIGTIQDKMGDFIIEKADKTPVIVSTKSQEEMIKETKSTLKKQVIAAIILGALGLASLIGGLVSGGSAQ